MSDEDMMRERLSALADGELAALECHDALAYAQTEQGQASWQAYHVIGDVMRGMSAVPMLDGAMLERLRSAIAQEALPTRLPVEARELPQVASPRAEAANASVLHWKLAAGFASLTAAVALGWTAYASLGPQNAGGAGAQMAAIPAVGTVVVAEGGQNVIRDPRLDALVQQVVRHGGSSQMERTPFLHNIVLEGAPQR